MTYQATTPKSTRRKYFKSFAWLAVVALIVIGCWPRGGNWFSIIDVKVPNSAIVSHESYPTDTGGEDLIVLQLSPTQMQSFLAQLKTKRHFRLAPAGNASSSTGSAINGLAPINKFFSSVPPRAQNGSLQIQHGEGSSKWFILCSFAIDHVTGRVWFYAWSVYN